MNKTSDSKPVTTVGQVLAFLSWCLYMLSPADPAGAMMIWCIAMAGSYILVAAVRRKGIRTRIFIGVSLPFMVPAAMGNIAIHPTWLPDLPYERLAFYVPVLAGVALIIHWMFAASAEVPENAT